MTWTQRRWLVRSVAFAQGQQQKLHKRLNEAIQELSRLAERRQGKKRLDAAGLLEAAFAVLTSYQAIGLLEVTVRTQQRERIVRGYRGKPDRVEVEPEYHLQVRPNEAAIQQRQREMGWQVYAINQVELPLEGVVRAYRGQYHIEGDWSRLKGRPLSLEPMYLKDEERMQGLVLLLMVAVRLLTLLQWQVRENLREAGEKLKGIYPVQAGRQTNRPSAERLLEAFKGISLSVIEAAGKVSVHITPLTALQEKLLALWELPSDLFHRLALHSAEPPRVFSER